MIPTLAPRPSARASAIQIPRTPRPNALPTPIPTPQAIESSPTPSPSPTRSNSFSPIPTSSPSGSPAPTSSPEPTKTPAPTSSPVPTNSPSPIPTILTPPEPLPTPPAVEEPKKLVFVEPKTPTVIPPQTLPEPPASPIVITKQPEYGSVTVTPAGQITYTSELTNPKSTTVDVVELTYTSLSGAVVVVRKEFILAQRGDVPAIIQTGYEPTTNPVLPFVLLAVISSIAFIARKRGRSNV